MSLQCSHPVHFRALFLPLLFTVSAFCVAAPDQAAMSKAPVQSGGQVAQFPSAFRKPSKLVPKIDYDFDYKKEQFFIYVPPSYTGREPFGLILFMDPGKGLASLPAGWDAVLEREKLLLVAPQNVGNGQPDRRRNGLGVIATLSMMRHYNIDSARVYAAGFSGGARVASDLGFYHSETFRGTIQSCGTNFFKPVPAVAVTSADRAGHPEPYGVADISTAEAEMAKAKVKFVLITGANDFRYHYIQDIYNGGFKPCHFKADLLEIEGMGHQICNATALQSALDFLKAP